MKTTNKFKALALANESFSQEKYDQALRHYAQVLSEHPESKEAYNGAILAEMAMSGEEAAEALFDYYEVLREESGDEAHNVIAEILQTLDGTVEQIGAFIDPMRNRLEFEDGILYSDFKNVVEEQGDFRTVFENIMFSTRVLIAERDDFLDFLERLMDHGYEEIAMRYIETALSLYPNDASLRSVLLRLVGND